MDNKIMFKNEYSCIVIHDEKLYIMNNKYKEYSLRAVTIIPGFQLELGRDIKEIKEALKETRLPIIIKKLTELPNGTAYYQIIRIHTGNVDDKVVTNVVCIKDKITSIAFNKALLKDSNYRKYNQLSVYHQLSVPYDLAQTEFNFRGEQIDTRLSTVIKLKHKIKIVEDTNKISAIIQEDDKYIQFLFILNKNNNRFELSSIGIGDNV